MSVAWVAVGASVLGTVANMSSASDANATQQKAIDAQSGAADGQLKLAQDQWDYQKNIYLPKAMQQADDNAALTKQLAQKQMSDMDYYRGVSQDAIDQAKKSYKYQDQYMGMADKYANGTMANTMADEANADVEQAASKQRDITQRNMERYGLNPGSGSAMALMHDDQNATALAGAGAQTMARRMARDKAEQMVGIAAGSGNAGFGTGLNAGGLATGAGTASAGASGAGLTGTNSVANTYANGGYSAGATLRGAGATGYGLGQSYGGNLGLDSLTSTLAGVQKSGVFGSGSPFAGAIGSLGARLDGSYNANYSNEGNNYPAATGISGSAGSDYTTPQYGYGTPQAGP